MSILMKKSKRVKVLFFDKDRSNLTPEIIEELVTEKGENWLKYESLLVAEIREDSDKLIKVCRFFYKVVKEYSDIIILEML